MYRQGKYKWRIYIDGGILLLSGCFERPNRGVVNRHWVDVIHF